MTTLIRGGTVVNHDHSQRADVLIDDGRIVGVMPIDSLSWTETISKVVDDCTTDAHKLSPTGSLELRITGQATPLARKELRARGWRLVENDRF